MIYVGGESVAASCCAAAAQCENFTGQLRLVFSDNVYSLAGPSHECGITLINVRCGHETGELLSKIAECANLPIS